MTIKTNAMFYKDLAFEIICDYLKKGKISKPDKGVYYIISIDFGLKRPVFYRMTHDHVETTDRFTKDILGDIYYVDRTTMKG